MNIELRKILSEQHGQIVNRANNSNLCYSAIFWVSIFGTIEHRVGYFENSAEARCWSISMAKTYNDLKIPYVIYSNSHNTIDKDLLKNI